MDGKMNNKHFVIVSCWVNVCKVREEVDNNLDIQVFEFECTADKSRVLVKQQVEIKTAETRTFCMFKVWLQRENSYEIFDIFTYLYVLG